jgi:hypothetical protein
MGRLPKMQGADGRVGYDRHPSRWRPGGRRRGTMEGAMGCRYATARGGAVLPAACLAALLVTAPAAAQTQNSTQSNAQGDALAWTERPFNPPVGSRWLIRSRTDTRETGSDGRDKTQTIRTRSEFTVAEKLPQGFRIVYVNREITMSGGPVADIMNGAFAAVKDIEMRAEIDAAGKPVSIENLEEVKSAMRTVTARTAQAFQTNPRVAAAVKDMMGQMLVLDGRDAAVTYMEELPLLAAGHNTGLKPGVERRDEDTAPNPFGAPIKSVLVKRLVGWDDATGKVKVVQRREMDNEAMRTATLALVDKFLSAAGKLPPADMSAILRTIKFDISSETVFNVEDGMTRSLEDHSSLSVALPGASLSKRDTKVVTVTPLQ